MPDPVLLSCECVIPEDQAAIEPATNGPYVLEELGTVDGCGAPQAVIVTVGDHLYRYDRGERLGSIDPTGDRGGWVG